MIYLVQSALDISAEHVDGGLCADSPKVLARVNKAVRRLLQSDDFGYSIDTVRFWTQNNSISLPREYVAARLVNICGTPVSVESRSYEFMASGPGEFAWDQSTKLIDEGTHPVYFDIPADYTCKLFAVSTESADKPLEISFKGRSSNGSELMNNGNTTLTMPIDAWDGVEGVLNHAITQTSDTSVHKLTHISLPTGRKGYVTLYAYEESTGRMWFMGKYHPSETTPGYRRYRLPVFCKDGIQVHCLCKKQYIPATSGQDVLLVQNPDAVKMMVMAIEAENNRDLNGAVALKQMAVQNLNVQERNETKNEPFRMMYDTLMNSGGINII